jgi:hypothetical protein
VGMLLQLLLPLWVVSHPLPAVTGGVEAPVTVAAYWVVEESLRSRPVSGTVRRLRGGNMLKYTLRLRDGSARGVKVLFKPDQEIAGSDYRKEVAAYLMDRALALHHVPVTIERSLPCALFLEADPEHAAALPCESDEVPGAVQVWVRRARDPLEDRARNWALDWLGRLEQAAGFVERPAEAVQFADLVVFDYLQRNPDRYTGGNLLLDRGGHYWFIDNAAAFSGATRPIEDFERLARFDPDLVATLRTVDDGALDGMLSPYLWPAARRRLLARRRKVLERVDRLVALHGEDAVFIHPDGGRVHAH